MKFLQSLDRHRETTTCEQGTTVAVGKETEMARSKNIQCNVTPLTALAASPGAVALANGSSRVMSSATASTACHVVSTNRAHQLQRP